MMSWSTSRSIAPPDGQIGDGRKLAVQRLDKVAQTQAALGVRQRRAGRPAEQLLD
jgi:hypothetical protein